MKKWMPIMLVLLLTFALTPAIGAEGTLDNFQKTVKYTEGQFVDVKAGDWYAESVKAGYEYGLIKGMSETTFSPNGNMTIAEAITLAARLNSIYKTGSASFEQGTPWYQVYVDYAVSNGIIGSGDYTNYNAKATRAQFALIFASALPDSALEKINNIKKGDIPDVQEDGIWQDAVYKLYNAGILTGNDAYGTFYPESNIKRSEVAAIVTRMADISLRKTVELKVKPVPVEGITLNEDDLTLNIGDKYSLTATVSPSNATEKTVLWESGNERVVTVENGVITAKGIGFTYILATCNGKMAHCYVTVQEVPVDSISLNLDKLNLKTGQTKRLIASVKPANATNNKVFWMTSDSTVATVNDGLVTAVGEGTATITAYCDGGRVNTRCYVTVKDPPPVTLIVKDTFPKTLYGYSPFGEIRSSVTVTGVDYSVRAMNNDMYRVTITFSGVINKTDATGSARLYFKVLDSEGYLVEGGRTYSPNGSPGDKFRDKDLYDIKVKKGTYYLYLNHDNQ